MEQVKMEERDYLAYTLGVMNGLDNKVNWKRFDKGVKVIEELTED